MVSGRFNLDDIGRRRVVVYRGGLNGLLSAM